MFNFKKDHIKKRISYNRSILPVGDYVYYLRGVDIHTSPRPLAPKQKEYKDTNKAKDFLSLKYRVIIVWNDLLLLFLSETKLIEVRKN